jgi:hypothetical protein
MKLPPEIEFHPDIRLLIYRPRGLIDEAVLNKIVSVIEDLEAETQEPFNRFSDTSGIHEVELNFRYVIHVSLHRRLSHKGRAPVKSAILATDSTVVHYARLLALLTKVLRSMFSCSPIAKKRRNGSVSRSNGWRPSHRPRTTLGESME